MLVNSQTRVIALSDLHNQYSIFTLPSPKDHTPTLYLFATEELFELREINGCNPYKNNNIFLPQSSIPVRSWIFERDIKTHKTEGESQGIEIPNTQSGATLSSPNLVISSKFDLMYLVLSFLCTNNTFSKRFFTVEDFIDTLSATEFNNGSKFTTDWEQKFISWYPKILESLCEKITENDEIFYKYSEDKCIQLLSARITALVDYLSNKPSQLMQSEKNMLYDIDETIPENILTLATRRTATNLICCYLQPCLVSRLLQLPTFDFKPLEIYIKELKEKKKDLIIAESQINAIAESSAKIGGKKKKPEPKKKATVKKVAVGKGALDSFFKRDK